MKNAIETILCHAIVIGLVGLIPTTLALFCYLAGV